MSHQAGSSEQPSKARPQKRSEMLAAQLKKHRHLISFSGALIVFVTFIVKEGLADRWKDEASALDMAQYVYTIRAETSSALAKEQSSATMRALPDATPGTLIESGAYREMAIYTYEHCERVQRLQGDLQNLKALMKRLPAQEQHQKELERLEETSRELWQSLFGSYALFTTVAGHTAEIKAGTITRGIKESLDRVPTEWAKAGNLFGKVFEFSNDVETLRPSVLNDADTWRQKNELRSLFAWWMAAGLYTIGWTLAVVARLSGVPASDEE